LRAFKTTAFARFARKEGISDSMLCAAVKRAERRPDADLGDGVIKQRVARPNEGRSGGYRTIVVFRRGTRAFFVHGFAKSDKANISRDEERAFKKLADAFLNAPESSISRMLSNETLEEVTCYGEAS
jgi:hypothetical protein